MRILDEITGGEGINKLNKNLETDFIRYTLKSIGATILGAKPAELKNIKVDKGNYELWDKCKNEILCYYEQIKIIELNQGFTRRKILFYHQAALDKQLDNLKALNFLRKLGYPEEYKFKLYLDLLVTKLKKHDLGAGVFPHEIGIFLGYPLKDVLGFMGYSDLEYTCREEWKVYGDKTISSLQKNRFDLARAYFSKKLDQVQNIKKVYTII
ncbi:DUF3793 family protein [Natroniella acetigena]|uniref:DUF3793 family protein n=1 Tax=Natroniella acetigena TaxID=52004 RepID=UPI00200ACF19|nr:DUF3793 family protein [Natroniella acetigena]MCK8827651.1 DUF3793 family protein [Natroniella acetigena]